MFGMVLIEPLNLHFDFDLGDLWVTLKVDPWNYNAKSNNMK